jgi:hypothetical protein
MQEQRNAALPRSLYAPGSRDAHICNMMRAQQQAALPILSTDADLRHATSKGLARSCCNVLLQC